MTARLVIVWMWDLSGGERKTLQAKRATREEPSKCRFLVGRGEKNRSVFGNRLMQYKSYFELHQIYRKVIHHSFEIDS